ncbi:MAG TPA: tripartite tricarboxylate transporter substrate binding protein [Acetobacteraceae bacterium]|nr:tripartite tricarboxylate transporter substrate binding protein [Acetobacteraceae bacterium]
MRPVLSVLLAILLVAPAVAQERTVRVIAGFAAGGTGDLVARLAADAIGSLLGARAVVENRTGANGLIAAAEVARSGTDGNTVLQCPMGTMTISPELPGAALPVDPRTELTGIANIALSTYGFVVAANGPWRDVPQLLEAARARPGALTYASAGVGSAQHLSGELLKARTGLDITHVPYRGATPAIVDILGGRADFMITNLGDVMRQVQGGELRLLALGDPGGSPLFPEARPVSAFIPGLEMAGWFGLCGPRTMPPEQVARWAEATRRALEHPALQRRLLESGLTPRFEGPEAFNARILADRQRWGEVIRTARIRAE